MKMFAKSLAAFKYGRGLMHFIKKRYHKAIKSIEHSLNLDPELKDNTWHTYSVLGRSYLALGDIEKADKSIKKAMDMFEKEGGEILSKFDQDEYNSTLMAYDKINKRKSEHKTK
jgi:tetratricopeptide (TPR) repeat protein